MNNTLRVTGRLAHPIDSLGLGVFDGMHLGHQAIASQCSALLTFYPHPDIVLRKKNDMKMLSSLKELRYYSKNLLVLHFSKVIAQLSAKEFLDKIVLPQQPKTLVVGYDFRFGSKKTGDISFMKSWATQHNILVIETPPICHRGIPIKSSAIRHQFQHDHFDQALELLGHPYLIMGRVIEGEKRGRTLGFPTANLAMPRYKLLPHTGVYRGKVQWSSHTYPAMIYIGNKPTFGKYETHVEVHIPGFEGNLYGKTLKLQIEGKIRPDMRFSDKDALVAQIKKDIEIASTYH